MRNNIIRIISAVAIVTVIYFAIEKSIITLIMSAVLCLILIFAERLASRASFTFILWSILIAVSGFVVARFADGAYSYSVFSIRSLTYSQVLIIKVLFIVFCLFVLIKSFIKERKPKGFINNSVYSSDNKTSDCKTFVADISILEEGRIYNLINTSFVNIKLITADFIVKELRRNSESSDTTKSYKARRALNIISKLETEGNLSVKDCSKEITIIEPKSLSDKTIALALKLKIKIMTVDFNLEKKALLQKVGIVNLMNISDALSAVYVPGDSASIYLVKEGEHANQGIGFLNDGSMVIVEEGKKHIGKKTNINITSIMQSSAGKLIFGKVSSSANHSDNKNSYKKTGGGLQ
jgi:uncharacterized protein YacL